MMNFTEFTKSKLRNQWIKEPHMQVYVRKSRRFVNDELIPCFDVASIQVKESHQGKGLFTNFLKMVEEYSAENSLIVFVESVLNVRLRKFLERNGYIHHPSTSEICPSYYKPAKTT